MQASDWVSRVNAKVAAMEFTNKDTAVDEIAEVVADEIVNELSGVSDDDLRSVTRTVFQNLPNIKIIKTATQAPEAAPTDTDPDDDNMPGLISHDYCNIHQAMYVASDKDAYSKICDTIDDLYEWADRQDKELDVEQDDKGRTLLHWALLFRCPSMVVQTLINAYPDILTYADDEDWLPLHYAARYSMSLDVVHDVYSVYPEAILELNETGIPPALIARYGGAPKDVVQFLEDKMKAMKAVAKAEMKAAEKAVADAAADAAADAEEESSEEEVDNDDPAATTEEQIQNNADNFDVFLMAFCGVSVVLLALILAKLTEIAIPNV